MCWLKRKNEHIFRLYNKQETPPKAPVSKDAVVVVWSEDRESFGEVFFENGAYKYSCWSLSFDEDIVGFYWSPIRSKFASFFDTLDKAKQAVKDTIQSK
ncbi:MAG: hypothetical protein EOM87_08370 [Clostridia bacterium]|nr:hypothetical protein [Clostridia bacterium]